MASAGYAGQDGHPAVPEATYRNSVVAPEIQHSSVEDYYGKQLQTSNDLKTDACCTASMPPKHIREILRKIHDDVIAKYYGCGLCIPDALDGCKVLDLGSGSGRDVYLLSALVGEQGRAFGLDMTEEQLATARSTIDYHAKTFGFANVEFAQGFIEQQTKAFPDYVGKLDVVISNCVVNLSPDKRAVLKNAFDMLKEGGEFYFSDVYASERVPSALKQDPVLAGECLSGALYWNDFVRLAKECGFADPRLVSDSPIAVKNEKLQEKIGENLKFFSATYRLFKLTENDALEPDCEDYGQSVRYLGTIPHCPRSFILDGHHEFRVGKMEAVCGNTYNMLKLTRFAKHFEFFGDFSRHYGIFPGCGKNIPFESAKAGGAAGGCC